MLHLTPELRAKSSSKSGASLALGCHLGRFEVQINESNNSYLGISFESDNEDGLRQVVHHHCTNIEEP